MQEFVRLPVRNRRRLPSRSSRPRPSISTLCAQQAQAALTSLQQSRETSVASVAF
jgi:hypothetical protein